MKVWTVLLGTLSFCLLWFLGWEAWGIYDARSRTDALFEPYRGPLDLHWSDLDPAKQEVLLAVLDPEFQSHQGIDFAIGITIPERLADRLYFESVTPGFAGFERKLIAFFVITPLVSKEVQLTAFLDLADFGSHKGKEIKGFPEASRFFFREGVRTISLEQFSRLAVLLKDPARYPMNSDANWAEIDRLKAYWRGECPPPPGKAPSLAHC